jgi:hypothetical protein
MNFTVEMTRNRIPCLWERGGEKSEGNGYAQLITNQNGLPKMPIMLNQSDEETDEHALLPATVKSHIVEVKRKNYNYSINIYEIININGNQAETKQIYNYKEGKWDKEPSMKFYDVIQRGIEKTKDSTSFAPYYIME